MYQTVGHDAIELYSEAMGLPLFQRTIQGSPIEQGKDYNINNEDEVEDLYKLLKEVMVGNEVYMWFAKLDIILAWSLMKFGVFKIFEVHIHKLI